MLIINIEAKFPYSVETVLSSHADPYNPRTEQYKVEKIHLTKTIIKFKHELLNKSTLLAL